MRIIAGKLGGRQFDAPRGHKTHPMSDKVRGALFNTLGDINGLSVLDAFAGSGALSFEAVSRGALSAVAIDNDKKAVEAIKRNIKSLKLDDEVKAIHANSSSWSDNNKSQQFDLVICAPPYDNLQLNLIKKLAQHAKEGGLYILDWPGKMQPPAISGLNLITAKLYGDAQLVFYRRNSGGRERT